MFLKTRIAKLEGEKKSLQLVVDSQAKKIKILEASSGTSDKYVYLHLSTILFNCIFLNAMNRTI